MAEEIVVSAMPVVCNNRLPRRIKLNEEQLEKITLEELLHNWREQDLFIDILESQTATQDAEIASLRESEERMRQQHSESSHREKVLVRRLATKEQEMQEYVSQIAEFKAGQTAGSSALRSALLDPAVNLLLQLLRGELLSTRSRLEETQNELSAWKFTPDSNTGKRLMAKCRLLYQENEELGRMISSGRLAKLEGELALQKSFSDEVKKSQSELDEFLQDLDEDVEGMQSTIYYLQQELRKSKEALLNLQQQKNNMNHDTCSSFIMTNKASLNMGKDPASSTQLEVKAEAEEFSPPPLKDKHASVTPADDVPEETHDEKTPEKDLETNDGMSAPSSGGDANDSGLNLSSDDKNYDEKSVDVQLTTIAYMETPEMMTEASEADNNGGNGSKEEIDDQDSQGELMIEVSSEPRDTVDEEDEDEEGDDEDDDDEDEDYEKPAFEEKLACNGPVNGVIHLETVSKEESVDTGVMPLRRRKRGAPESSPTSSDEDSDDTPLIKKVRRHHELLNKSKA